MLGETTLLLQKFTMYNRYMSFRCKFNRSIDLINGYSRSLYS